MAGFLLLVVVASVVCVALDAGKYDWTNNPFARSAFAWAVGTALLWIIVLPMYLMYRGRTPLKNVGGIADGGRGAGRLSSPTAQMSDAPGDFVACIDCAEPIRVAARKCRFCGVSRTPEPTS